MRISRSNDFQRNPPVCSIQHFDKAHVAVNLAVWGGPKFLALERKARLASERSGEACADLKCKSQKLGRLKEGQREFSCGGFHLLQEDLGSPICGVDSRWGLVAQVLIRAPRVVAIHLFLFYLWKFDKRWQKIEQSVLSFPS